MKKFSFQWNAQTITRNNRAAWVYNVNAEYQRYLYSVLVDGYRFDYGWSQEIQNEYDQYTIEDGKADFIDTLRNYLLGSENRVDLWRSAIRLKRASHNKKQYREIERLTFANMDRPSRKTDAALVKLYKELDQQ